MRDYTITELTSNHGLEALEVEGDHYGDARQQPRPSDALPDSVEAEMASCFGWGNPPTDEEMEADYAARRCDEQDLLARHPDLAAATDDRLIALIAEPTDDPDADERAAAAAILLERRLTAGASLVPILKASLAFEAAKRRD